MVRRGNRRDGTAVERGDITVALVAGRDAVVVEVYPGVTAPSPAAIHHEGGNKAEGDGNDNADYDASDTPYGNGIGRRAGIICPVCVVGHPGLRAVRCVCAQVRRRGPVHGGLSPRVVTGNVTPGEVGDCLVSRGHAGGERGGDRGGLVGGCTDQRAVRGDTAVEEDAGRVRAGHLVKHLEVERATEVLCRGYLPLHRARRLGLNQCCEERLPRGHPGDKLATMR